MNHLARHVWIPSTAPLIFFAVAFSPVEFLGCRSRGLLALAVSLTSGLLAIATALTGLKLRIRGDPESIWWVRSTLILSVPVAGMLALA